MKEPKLMNIREALQKARGRRQAMPRGRAILEVEGIDAKRNTVTGTIRAGAGIGETITIHLNQKIDKRQLVAQDLLKGRAKMDIAADGKPGGTLQVEGLAAREDGDYDIRWIKTFQARPSQDGQSAILGETFRLNIIQNRDGKRTANIAIPALTEETFTRNAAEMRAAMIKAWDEHGAVTLALTDESGAPVEASYYARLQKTDDGTYVRESGEARMEEFEKSLGVSIEEAFGEALAKSGVSVVPLRTIMVGKETWAAVEQKFEERGRGGSVDPSGFRVAPLGVRVAAAWNRLESEADKEAVRNAFLAGANENAKKKFHAGGFAAVEDRDVAAFLETSGKKPIETPSYGYVSGAILTLPYDRDNPDNGVMVTKAFPITGATPFLPVKAFEDVRKAWYAEARTALEAIAAREMKGPGAAQQAAAPAAASAGETPETPAVTANGKAAPAPAAEPAGQDMDDLDAFLMQVTDAIDDDLDARP